MKTHYLLFGALLCLLLVCIIKNLCFDYVLGGYLSKFCQISNSFNLRNEKVLCCWKICGKRESAVWEVLGTELLVVIWIADGQACWLTWMNLSLRSLLSPFSPLVFVVTGSVGEP